MSGSGVVTFSPQEFFGLFPEFQATVSAQQAMAYFTVAQQWCDNTLASPVADYSVGGARDTYLNFLTAHLAMLFTGTAAQPAQQIVGRVSGATEGSVSVQVDMPTTTNLTQAWFTQTKYGFAFWSMTAQYRYGGLYSPPRMCGQVGVTGSQFPGTIAASIPGWF